MSKSFTVTVDGTEFKLEKYSDGKITLNGKEIDYNLDLLHDGEYALRIGNTVYDVAHYEDQDEDEKRTVYVDGMAIDLVVEDERTALINKYESAAATQLQSAIIKAPMPGKIAKLLVAEGELIEEGQGVVILEAMKMENELKAPASGIVKRISVKDGDAVEKNATLIEVE